MSVAPNVFLGMQLIGQFDFTNEKIRCVILRVWVEPKCRWSEGS